MASLPKASATLPTAKAADAFNRSAAAARVGPKPIDGVLSSPTQRTTVLAGQKTVSPAAMAGRSVLLGR